MPAADADAAEFSKSRAASMGSAGGADEPLSSDDADAARETPREGGKSGTGSTTGAGAGADARSDARRASSSG